MNAAPTPMPPDAGLQHDPLTAVAVPLAPIVLEGRYRVLVGALWRLGRSQRGQWVLAAGSGAVVIVLALLAARHFATTAWPLASGDPGLLAAAGLLLLLAQALKAYGWGRLFTPDERPKALGGVRAGLAVVAAARVAAAAVILALPRLAASGRAVRFRLGRWLSPRTTSRRAASQAWVLVSVCWHLRAVALFLLLGTLGAGFSFPLALLFLCAGAARRRCRSVRRARPRRSGPAPRPLSLRASEPRRHSLAPSRSALSGSSLGPRSCFSP